MKSNLESWTKATFRVNEGLTLVAYIAKECNVNEQNTHRQTHATLLFKTITKDQNE